MKVYAVRKGDLWLNANGYDVFEPHLMSKARAEQLASQIGGVVEMSEVTKIAEYLVPRVALPELWFWVG